MYGSQFVIIFLPMLWRNTALGSVLAVPMDYFSQNSGLSISAMTTALSTYTHTHISADTSCWCKHISQMYHTLNTQYFNNARNHILQHIYKMNYVHCKTWCALYPSYIFKYIHHSSFFRPSPGRPDPPPWPRVLPISTGRPRLPNFSSFLSLTLLLP